MSERSASPSKFAEFCQQIGAEFDPAGPLQNPGRTLCRTRCRALHGVLQAFAEFGEESILHCSQSQKPHWASYVFT